MEPVLSYLLHRNFSSPDATLHPTQQELRKGTQIGPNLRYHLLASTRRGGAAH